MTTSNSNPSGGQAKNGSPSRVSPAPKPAASASPKIVPTMGGAADGAPAQQHDAAKPSGEPTIDVTPRGPAAGAKPPQIATPVATERRAPASAATNGTGHGVTTAKVSPPDFDPPTKRTTPPRPYFLPEDVRFEDLMCDLRTFRRASSRR